MKIEYDLDVKDLVQWGVFQYRNSPAFIKIQWVLYGLNLGLAGLGLVLFIGSMVVPTTVDAVMFWGELGFKLVFMGVTSALILFIVLRLIVGPAARGMINRDGGQIGRYALELLEGGLVEYSEGRTLRVGWPRIRKLVTHKKHLYIFRETLGATVVPLRAFRDRDEFRRFLEILMIATGRPVAGLNIRISRPGGTGL